MQTTNAAARSIASAPERRSILGMCVCAVDACKVSCKRTDDENVSVEAGAMLAEDHRRVSKLIGMRRHRHPHHRRSHQAAHHGGLGTLLLNCPWG